jgi:hypothetical protein
MNNDLPKILAFYLPQFHPTPENDEWWGKGFTEWTNVTKAKPLYKNHYQPHLPSDLGFYDLRLESTRQAQATLAKEYGIDGFCYYHYWFEGKRLLNNVTDAILSSGNPEIPFCLCWANETWSKRWLGEDKEILIKQTYSVEDCKNHARYLSSVFEDERYIRVNGKPLFIIYKYIDIPQEIDVIQIMQDEWRSMGKDEAYMVAIDVHNRKFDFNSVGFDDVIAFEPALGELPDAFNDTPLFSKLKRNLSFGLFNRTLKVYDYKTAVEMMHDYPDKTNRIPSLLVRWDNSARRGDKGIIFENCNPETFAYLFEQRLIEWKAQPKKTNLFFLNAWNEWAEGNHLEPDQKFGLSYLEKVKEVLLKVKRK